MSKLVEVKRLKSLMMRNEQLSVMARGSNVLTLRKVVEEKDDVVHQILRILCADMAGRVNG